MSRDTDWFGVLAIDKPASMTSRDVVNQIQRILKLVRRSSHSSAKSDLVTGSPVKVPSGVKLGHTGTLDPMATGVLLVVIGQATRLVEYSHELPKTYEADFAFGMRSDTLDSTGKVEYLPTAPELDRKRLLAELPRWLGRIRQRPPKVSAIHVNGRRAYEMARRGVEFEVPTRSITIHGLDLLSFEYPRFSLRVQCSSGTYIRSLGADIAIALGSEAVMTRLVRTAIGPFQLADCVQLDDISTQDDILHTLQSPLRMLPHMAQITLDDADCQHLRQGKKLKAESSKIWIALAEQQHAVVIDNSDRPVAIVAKSERLIRPIRVFHSSGEQH